MMELLYSLQAKLVMLEVKGLGLYALVLAKASELYEKAKDIYWAVMDKLLLFGHKFMGS